MANPWDAPRSPSFFPQQTSEFDENTRRRLDGLGPVKPQLTAEEIKVAWEEAVREDQAHKDRIASQHNADAFIEGHPELIDNTANAQLLLNQVETMFGKGLHTVEHWEAAYQYMRTNTDFLKLDKTVLAAQQKQTAKERYEAAKARTAQRSFNPNANYSEMSLEELRDRANQELQLAGEQQGANGF